MVRFGYNCIHPQNRPVGKEWGNDTRNHCYLYTTSQFRQTTQKHQNYDSSVNYAVNWLFTFLQVAISNRLMNQQPTDTVSESSTFRPKSVPRYHFRASSQVKTESGTIGLLTTVNIGINREHRIAHRGNRSNGEPAKPEITLDERRVR